MELNGIILAAGQGGRMRSRQADSAKALYPILGKPIVEYVLDAMEELGCDQIYTVVGYGKEATKAIVEPRTKAVEQGQTLGTAHAVLQLGNILKNKDGITAIIYGDIPLISGETLKKALKFHKSEKNKLTILTGVLDDPTTYGRVIREPKINRVLKIIEEEDCVGYEHAIKEVNAGFYLVDNKELFARLPLIDNKNNSGEYNLTDIVELFVKDNLKIGAWILEDAVEMFGINDRVQLAEAARVVKRRVNAKLMLSGVSIEDPRSTYISPDVQIGRDTVIGPNTTILGKSIIGEGNYIGPNNYFEDVEIGEDNKILSSYLTETKVGNHNEIGPFTKTRAHTVIDDNCRIGNFVELKNAHYKNGVKTAHLTYIGDAEVGERTNVGCMTVTANYDGYNKSRTSIGKDTFIGSGTIIVAPCEIEDESFTAAGSVITNNVHKGEMAIARARQVNKPDLRNTFLAKAKAKKEASKK